MLNSSHQNTDNQQQLTAQLQWLEAALSALHSPNHDTQQRKAAEAALVAWQRTDPAWILCLHLLQHPYHPNSVNLLLFAAQTLRTKINEQGARLPAEHLAQLKNSLLQKLLDQALPTALLRQLCLAVASCVALLPSCSKDWLQAAGAYLPMQNAVQLLHDVAEEGSSDWRHVIVPGLTSSEKLSWATTTRDRFRSWSHEALHLLHSCIQQQQQQLPQHPHQQQQQEQVAATASLLECFTAWVKLGCLHHVSMDVAEATAHVGLLHIQDAGEEVVSAALGLLTELPEFAPEQLISKLEPHMLQVAAAAVRAASSTPPDLMHAAAWASAFAAWAAAVPQKLLAAGEDEGGGSREVRQALLQVAGLPQIHHGQLVCLPALHCCSSVFSHDSPQSAARFAAAGGGCGGLSRTSTAADAAEEAAAAEAAVAVAAGSTEGSPVVLGHEVPSCLTQACLQLLLQTACNCMVWTAAAEGREAAGTCEASAAVHDVFLAACCLLGQEQYLQCVLAVWDPQQQHQQQGLGLQGRQELQQVLQCVASAPGELRLQGAVLMAAAAAVQGAAAVGQQIAGVDADLKRQQACSSIAGLLSQGAVQVRQGLILPGPLHAQLVLSFCKAAQVWAPYLALHFIDGSNEQGTAAMGSLLELLLAVAAQHREEGPNPTRSAAAAAIRALTSAALNLGWDRLVQAVPGLLQAVQHLSGVDSADQDLFASLSMALAAVGAPDSELQAIRARASQQLVQPVVVHLDCLLQQLQAGQQWSAMGKAADVLLCQHMVGVRVVLEAARQRQEHMHQHAAAGDLRGSGSGGTAEITASAPASAVTYGMEEDSGDMLEDAAWVTQQLDCTVLAPYDSGNSNSIQAELAKDPAVQLIATRLWGQLHVLVVQHGAAGKFLQHYAKGCSKLLKLQPELLLRPQQQLLQFVEVCVLGLVRPGGCALAEPLLASVELLCCQGSDLLLEAAPVMNQAYVQLWALTEVLSLQQSGEGDSQPDLTEAILRLSAAWVRHSAILQPSSAQVAAALPSIITAAATCARCCHKKVASAALATLVALLTTAVTAGPRQPFEEVVASHAVLVGSAALGALLVPSPLPRLQKVCSLLLELAALASLVEQPGTHTGTISQQQHGADVGVSGVMAPAHSSISAQQQLQDRSHGAFHLPAARTQGILHSWLLQATQPFVPAALSAQEAADLAAACAGLLASSPAAAPDSGDGSSQCRQAPASRSYVAARRLKKRLRDFAEKLMRTQSS